MGARKNICYCSAYATSTWVSKLPFIITLVQLEGEQNKTGEAKRCPLGAVEVPGRAQD